MSIRGAELYAEATWSAASPPTITLSGMGYEGYRILVQRDNAGGGGSVYLRFNGVTSSYFYHGIFEATNAIPTGSRFVTETALDFPDNGTAADIAVVDIFYLPITNSRYSQMRWYYVRKQASSEAGYWAEGSASNTNITGSGSSITSVTILGGAGTGRYQIIGYKAGSTGV